MTAVTIRPAGPGDAALIAELVREHAELEGAREQVRGTAEGYAHPGMACLIAEIEGRVAGFALYFANFSSWEGRPGLFLEDLYVRGWARGQGIGRRLVAALARQTQAQGGTRVDLVVARANDARRFYERLGLRHVEGWLLYRLDGDALDALAEDGPPPAGPDSDLL